MTTKITKTVAMIVATMSLMAPAVSHSVELSTKTAVSESYPGDIAISYEGSDKWNVRAFPKMLPIYTYDGDSSPGSSNCNIGCIGAWSPVLVTFSELRTIGDWSVITRNDGKLQWAYKGHPIYTYYNDHTDQVNGDNEENGMWHVLHTDNHSTTIAENIEVISN